MVELLLVVSLTLLVQTSHLNNASAALELASEGYLLALGDLSSNQAQLGQVASECTTIQKGLSISGFIPQVYYCPCDVSVESQVESLVQAALTTLGGVDVVGPSARYG